MKQFTFLFLFSLVGAIVSNLFAQAPQLINYQAVARNTNGQILANQVVLVRLSVSQSTAGGTIQYQETHNLTANAQGLITLQIGGGTPNSGTFTDITWADGQPKFLQIELDPDGAGVQPFVNMGSQQLVSVPYAIYSENTREIRKNSSNLTVASNYALTGTNNTALGLQALSNNTTGTANTAGGIFALFSNTTGINNTAYGNYALNNNNQGNFNVGIGSNALNYNTNGGNNVAIGYNSLFWNTGGQSNLAVGSEALQDNTTGSYNVAMGRGALFSNKSNNAMTAVGYNALYYAANGTNALTTNNTAVGYEALKGGSNAANNTGIDNTAVGSQSLRLNTTGYVNTAIGSQTLYANTTGAANTAGGAQVLYANLDGEGNTGYGHKSLFANVTGDQNTATGLFALFSSLGSYNTANGASSLYNNTSGNYNTGVGASALLGNTTGINNTALGYGANVSAGNLNNATAIGAFALAGASNCLVLGSINGVNSATADTKVGIGTTTPSKKFEVAGGDALIHGLTIGKGGGLISTCTAVGANALNANTTGDWNTAYGYNTLQLNSTGHRNTATGAVALNKNTTGYHNTGIGTDALRENTTGFQNTALGYMALVNNTTGDYNTAIGVNTGPTGSSAANLQNTTCVGIDATVTASNQVRIGNAFVTSIGGQVGWSTLSDARFKESVQETVPGLAFITKLRPVTYQVNRATLNNYMGVISSLPAEERNAKSEVITGFLAQDVEQAAHAAGFDFSGVDKPKNDHDLYGLRYAEFVVPLVKAVQEQQQMIEELKNQINKLQSQINQLNK